jgi:hypothetical protein
VSKSLGPKFKIKIKKLSEQRSVGAKTEHRKNLSSSFSRNREILFRHQPKKKENKMKSFSWCFFFACALQSQTGLADDGKDRNLNCRLYSRHGVHF